MAGYAPASLPHLSLVFDAATVGSVGDPWPLPHFALLQNDGVYTGTSETGVFTLSGQDAGLRPARKIIGAAGAFVLTGQDSTGTEGTYGSMEYPAPLPHLSLVLTGVSGLYALTAEPGAFILSGQAVTLRKGIGVVAETGVFVLSGAPAERDMEMNGDVGAFILTGVDAGLVIARPNLIGEAGVFTLTGNAANLSYSGADKIMAGFFGTFDLVGQDSSYTYTRALQCDVGVFTLTGEDAGYETTGTWEEPPAPEVSGEGWRGAGWEDDDPWWMRVPVKGLPAKVERALDAAAKLPDAQAQEVLAKKISRAGVEWQPEYAEVLTAMQEREAATVAALRKQIEQARLQQMRDDDDVAVALLLAA